MGPEFFQTKMGSKFFNSDVPRIANALETIAEKLNIEKQAENAGQYMMLITHSWDSDYIAVPCMNEDDAIIWRERYLTEEQHTIRAEQKYDPYVITIDDTEKILVYTKDFNPKEMDYHDYDFAIYKIVQAGHGHHPELFGIGENKKS